MLSELPVNVWANCSQRWARFLSPGIIYIYTFSWLVYSFMNPLFNNLFVLFASSYFNLQVMEFSSGIISTWSLRGPFRVTYDHHSQIYCKVVLYIFNTNNIQKKFISFSNFLRVLSRTNFYRGRFNLNSTIDIFLFEFKKY